MAYKRGGKQPHEIPYSERIASKLREMAPTSTKADMFAAIQCYQNAPASMTTFNKLYRKDIEAAKATQIAMVGSLVYKNALREDEDAIDNPLVQKDRHFILERKGGWTKTETLENRDVSSEEEENTSAVNALIAALGLDEESEETGEGE